MPTPEKPAVEPSPERPRRKPHPYSRLHEKFFRALAAESLRITQRNKRSTVSKFDIYGALRERIGTPDPVDKVKKQRMRARIVARIQVRHRRRRVDIEPAVAAMMQALAEFYRRESEEARERILDNENSSRSDGPHSSNTAEMESVASMGSSRSAAMSVEEAEGKSTSVESMSIAEVVADHICQKAFKAAMDEYPDETLNDVGDPSSDSCESVSDSSGITKEMAEIVDEDSNEQSVEEAESLPDDDAENEGTMDLPTDPGEEDPLRNPREISQGDPVTDEDPMDLIVEKFAGAAIRSRRKGSPRRRRSGDNEERASVERMGTALTLPTIAAPGSVPILHQIKPPVARPPRHPDPIEERTPKLLVETFISQPMRAAPWPTPQVPMIMPPVPRTPERTRLIEERTPKLLVETLISQPMRAAPWPTPQVPMIMPPVPRTPERTRLIEERTPKLLVETLISQPMRAAPWPTPQVPMIMPPVPRTPERTRLIEERTPNLLVETLISQPMRAAPWPAPQVPQIILSPPKRAAPGPTSEAHSITPPAVRSRKRLEIIEEAEPTTGQETFVSPPKRVASDAPSVAHHVAPSASRARRRLEIVEEKNPEDRREISVSPLKRAATDTAPKEQQITQQVFRPLERQDVVGERSPKRCADDSQSPPKRLAPDPAPEADQITPPLPRSPRQLEAYGKRTPENRAEFPSTPPKGNIPDPAPEALQNTPPAPRSPRQRSNSEPGTAERIKDGANKFDTSPPPLRRSSPRVSGARPTPRMSTNGTPPTNGSTKP